MSTLTVETQTLTTQKDDASTTLRPRRTLNRLALALVALFLAAIGQYLLQRYSLWDGLLVYLAAVVLFVRSVGYQLDTPDRFDLINPQENNRLAACNGWRRYAGVWAMLIGIGLSVLGYSFFGRDGVRLQAWWLYLGSIVVFTTGGLLLTPGQPVGPALRRVFPKRGILAGLLVIMAIALFMRFYHFTEQPFGIWFDEAEAGLEARQILGSDQYRPVFFAPINVTGHLLWLYAQALDWLGNNIYALRSVSVLFGLAGVVAAFLFGQELRGPRFGLALAFFVAVARWHVNFSRIAMTGVDAPFFEFLSLYFLTRLFKHGRLRDALWAGFSLGVGLLFYTAFRLYLVALVLFAIIAAARWSTPVIAALRQKGWQRWLGAAAILGATIWLLVAPIVQYAVDNPEEFWYRTRQISILTKRDQADLTTALLDSTRKHLLMFHVFGDRNGRHNLPGEPMLDPLMGMLMLLGIGLALVRTRHPTNLFFLILLPVTLVGGIFSVDFEAPQSLRSIAAIPAVIYFCALSVAALGKEAEQSFEPLPRAWLFAPLVAVGGFVLYSNAHTYFYRQGNDFASWNAFSAPETITGRKMAELGDGYVYYLSPFLTNHPTTRFLAPEITNQRFLLLPDALPVRDSSGRPVVLFIHPDEQWVFDKAQQIYPGATFEVLTGPRPDGSSGGPPSVFFVLLEPADLRSVRGLDLRYLPTSEEDPMLTALLAPLHASRANVVNVVWPEDSPTDKEFVAEWSGILYVPRYGPYGFRLISPAGSKLEIDGNVVLEGSGEQSTGLTLAQGNHTLRVEAEGAPGEVVLYWQPPGAPETQVPAWALYARPVTNHGLLGTFYPNNNWEGQPAFQRIDPFLDTYFHLVPLQRPYTVEWTGSLVAPQSGLYRLGLRAVQEAELLLDGQPLVKTTVPNRDAEASINLEVGLHNLVVRYRDTVDRSRIHLTWTTPNGQSEAIPSEYLWPPLGSYPVPPAESVSPTPIASIRLEYLRSMGMPGSGPGEFVEPRDVTVFSNGNIAVADTGNRRVQVFDAQYNFLAEINSEAFPFEEPLALDVLKAESDDELLVLDSTLQWVYRFAENGDFLERFGGPEVRLFHPRGMNVFDGDSVGISDTGTARLVLFNARGEQMGVLGGGPGNSPGQLNEPTDAVRDTAGTYFVVEAENNRLQRLDSGGSHMAQWAIPEAYAYNGPHLALGPDGSLLMTESQSQVLLRYTPSGVLVDQWQTIGPIRLVAPVGIYFDHASSRLYVTDIGTHQVHIFQVEVVSED